ncbi:MAG TPA: hypothetical protein VLX92_26595, partial [Kofleriaceae bacterium]|nr:hypothetical protein [Kofleriaceae bacterium]
MALGRWLAGDDGPAHAGLPVSELLAPLPLVALAALVINDWLLKGSAAPQWLTGKLSDVAGLFVFPLIATAALDLALYAAFRLGAPIDFTLRRYKLGVAIALTAAGFAVLKLSPELSGYLARALGALVGRRAEVYLDPSDLVALVVLPLTWLHGRRVLARGAYGRLALARRRPRADLYADATACGADPTIVAALEAAVAAWLAG